MTVPTDFINHPVSQAVAWALVHFLWQGALVGLGAFAALRLFRLAPPARYVIGVAALALMAAAPVITTGVMLGEARPAGIAAASAMSGSRPDSLELAALGAMPSVAGQGALSAERDRLSLESIVLAIWFVGVSVLSLRLLGGWIVARRLARRAIRSASPEIQSLAQRIAGRLALDRVVCVVESSAVAVPMLVGWLKPVVLLPASALSGLTPTQVEALLAHELAHIRRHDYLVNLLQSVVETLLFYHPAVWWVSRQVRREREHCCDDLAVGVCDRLEYVTALASLAAMTAPPRTALAATDGSLVGRVRRLLTPGGDDQASRSSGWIAVCAILLTVVVVRASVGASLEAPVADGQAAVATSADSLAGGQPAQAQERPVVTTPAGGVSGGVPGGVSSGVPGGVQGGAPGGVAGGVVGGVPGGVIGGVTGGVLDGIADGVQAAARVAEEQERAKRQALREAEKDLRDAQREVEMRRLRLELERAQIEAQVQLETAKSQIDVLERQLARTKRMVEGGTAPPDALAEIEAQLKAASQQMKMVEADLKLKESDIELRVREAEARALYEQRMIELDVARLAAELSQARPEIEAAAAREMAAQAATIEAVMRATRQTDVERAVAQTELLKRMAEMEAARAQDPEQARRLEEQYREITERYSRMTEATTLGADESATVGDIVTITIADEPALPDRYRIDEDGTIRLPFLGSVRVLGLTAGQVREAVARQLSERNLKANPSVTVTIRRQR